MCLELEQDLWCLVNGQQCNCESLLLFPGRITAYDLVLVTNCIFSMPLESFEI